MIVNITIHNIFPVSIGRRLLDPLAEFVKIDPKHVGVGQYQVTWEYFKPYFFSGC